MVSCERTSKLNNIAMVELFFVQSGQVRYETAGDPSFVVNFQITEARLFEPFLLKQTSEIVRQDDIRSDSRRICQLLHMTWFDRLICADRYVFSNFITRNSSDVWIIMSPHISHRRPTHIRYINVVLYGILYIKNNQNRLPTHVSPTSH